MYNHNSAPGIRDESSLLYQNSTMLNESLKIPHHEYDGAQSPQHRHHGHSWRNRASPLMPQSWRDGQHMEPPPYGYPPHGYSQVRHYDHHSHHGGHHGSFYPPRHEPPSDYRYNSRMMENPDAYDPYHSSHYGSNDQYSGRSINSQQDHPHNFYSHPTRSRSMSDNYQPAYGHGHGPDPSAQQYHQNVPQGGSWAYDEINKSSSNERCDFDTYVRDGPITERNNRSRHSHRSQPNHHNPANRRPSPAFPGDMWNQCASIEPEKSITRADSNHLWPASASIDGDNFVGGGEKSRDGRFSRNSENDGNFDGLSSGKVSPV